MKKFALSALILTSLSYPLLSHAALGDGSMTFTLAGIANNGADEIQNQGGSGSINFGAGALVESNIYDRFGIETGALITDRKYTTEAGGLRLVQQTRRLHVPVLARLYATDFFSVGAGPFAGFKTGNVKTAVEGSGNSYGVASTSANDSVEYGVDAAATLNAALSATTGLFVEGRYSALLDERSDEEANEVYGLAGVKINI